MKIAIIGGGISGLSTAWALNKKFKAAKIPLSVTIYEQHSHFGGWIRSQNCEGVLCEAGPRGFRGSDKGLKTLQLIQEVGMENQLLNCSEKAKKRYLGYKERLQELPSNPLQLFFNPLGRCVLKAALKEKNIPYLDCEENVAQFFERRFGKSVLKLLVDPFISGIFAGDPAQLSINACFPQLKKAEKEYGSLVKAFLKKSKQPSSFYTFKSGMSSLIEALVAQLTLRGASLLFDQTVYGLGKSSQGWTVSSTNEEKIYDKIVLALPAPQLNHLIDHPSARSFLSLPYSSVASVHLMYKRSLKIPSGFGFLIPSSEKTPSLGVIFESSLKKEAGAGTHLSVLLGGARHPLVSNEPAPRLIDQAILTVNKYLKIDDSPCLTHVQIAHKAIPQYPIGFLSMVNDMQAVLKKEMPDIYLTGSSFYGVGINDCIDHADEISTLILSNI